MFKQPDCGSTHIMDAVSLSRIYLKQNYQREQILNYSLERPLIAISGDELFAISGTREYARRVWELKVKFGWFIIGEVTAKQCLKKVTFL